MSADELVRLVRTWGDAQTVAEVVANPMLRVGDAWDLHDWEIADTPDGLQFRHMNDHGCVMETVVMAPAEVGTEAEPVQVFVQDC